MANKVVPITQKVKGSYNDPEAPGKKIGDAFKNIGKGSGGSAASGTAAPPPSTGGGGTSVVAPGPSGTASTSTAAPSVTTPPGRVGSGKPGTPATPDTPGAPAPSGESSKKGLTKGQKWGIGIGAALLAPLIPAAIIAGGHKKRRKKLMEGLPGKKDKKS